MKLLDANDLLFRKHLNKGSQIMQSPLPKSFLWPFEQNEEKWHTNSHPFFNVNRHFIKNGIYNKAIII